MTHISPIFNKNDIIRKVQSETITIVTQVIPNLNIFHLDHSHIALVRYQLNNLITNNLYKYIRSMDLFTSIYDVLHIDDPKPLPMVADLIDGTPLVDIDSLTNEYLDMGNTIRLPSIITYSPINIHIPPYVNTGHSTPADFDAWISTWRITIMQYNRVRTDRIDFGIIPEDLLSRLLYVIIANQHNIAWLFKPEPIKITIGPEIYLSRHPESFGLHQDNGAMFNGPQVFPIGYTAQYTRHLSQVTLLYLPTNRDILMRSASVTLKSNVVYPPFGGPPTYIDIVSLPATFGTVLTINDPYVLHTSPVTRIANTDAEIRSNILPSFKIREKASYYGTRLDPTDHTGIVGQFPTTRTFIRLSYYNQDEDPMRTLEIIPIIPEVSITVDTLKQNNDALFTSLGNLGQYLFDLIGFHDRTNKFITLDMAAQDESFGVNKKNKKNRKRIIKKTRKSIKNLFKKHKSIKK